jgi:ABC-2 type transport system ATP-binding protein
VFLCTHNLDEADRLCDRIAFFKREVIRIDAPDRLRAELYGRTTEIRVVPSPRPEHLARVRAVEGVREAWLENGSIVVSTADPLHTNPILVRELVSAGAEVAFVSERRASLEDVYLRIVHVDEIARVPTGRSEGAK